MENRYRNTGGQQDYRDRYGSRERQSEQFSDGSEGQQGEDRGTARTGQRWQGEFGRSDTMRRDDLSRAGSGYRGDTSSLDDYDRYGSESRYGSGNAQRGSYGSSSAYGAGRYGASSSAAGYGEDRYPADRYGSDPHRSGGYGSGSYGAGNIPPRQYDADDRGLFDRASDEVMSWFGDDDAARRRRMDHRDDHRGRGPENYTRSNERLLEDACECLTRDSLVDASKIKVECADNEVTLNGTVDSRSAKRRAEDIVHDISGVKHVQNNLRVESRNSYYGSTDTEKGASSES